MTNLSDNPNQPRQVSARRQHRIDLANAPAPKTRPRTIVTLIRQRVGWFHDRGIPAESVRPRAKGASAHNSNAGIVGVPIETVIGQISQE